MRRILSATLFVAIPLLVFVAPLRSQVELSKVKVRVNLVDKDLNQKPVPHLAVTLAAIFGLTWPPMPMPETSTGSSGAGFSLWGLVLARTKTAG